MKVITTYKDFNGSRYGNPWVALVDPKTAKLDFTHKVGGYTGAYGKGEAGELYVINPIEGAVYAYGQKDYRGRGDGYYYVKYIDGQFVSVQKTDVVNALS